MQIFVVMERIALTKEEQVGQLVEWVIDSMDISELEGIVQEYLEEYYNSPEGEEDFNTNYAEMKEIYGVEE